MTQKKASTTKKASGKIKDQTLTRLIEEIIEQGADTAEEINRAVLDLPVIVLENLGLRATAKDVKKVQESSIGAIYKLIHEINHQVADLAADLLKQNSTKPKKPKKATKPKTSKKSKKSK